MATITPDDGETLSFVLSFLHEREFFRAAASLLSEVKSRLGGEDNQVLQTVLDNCPADMQSDTPKAEVDDNAATGSKARMGGMMHALDEAEMRELYGSDDNSAASEVAEPVERTRSGVSSISEAFPLPPPLEAPSAPPPPIPERRRGKNVLTPTDADEYSDDDDVGYTRHAVSDKDLFMATEIDNTHSDDEAAPESLSGNLEPEPEEPEDNDPVPPVEKHLEKAITFHSTDGSVHVPEPGHKKHHHNKHLDLMGSDDEELDGTAYASGGSLDEKALGPEEVTKDVPSFSFPDVPRLGKAESDVLASDSPRMFHSTGPLSPSSSSLQPQDSVGSGRRQSHLGPSLLARTEVNIPAEADGPMDDDDLDAQEGSVKNGIKEVSRDDGAVKEAISSKEAGAKEAVNSKEGGKDVSRAAVASEAPATETAEDKAGGEEDKGAGGGGDGARDWDDIFDDDAEMGVEDGEGLVDYSIELAEQRYETFPLKIIHRRNRTGFEETKDFPIRINSVVAGRYQVMEFLGSAAFSKAVQCIDLRTGMVVCIKIIKNNKDFLDQSLDEIKLLKLVNKEDPDDRHHLLRMYDYFYHKEHLFIVCELLRANLYEFQKYNRESGGEPYFTLPRLQAIARSCLEALRFLHSLDLIHCDLKPENILVKSYSRCQVKVIDLGSSCFTTDHLSSYVQSRSYRAPEVILGLPYGPKIDIWSLGCIVAELCSGYVLFQNDSLSTLLARVVGILGEIDRSLLDRGKYSHKFFTKKYQLYEINPDTGQYEILHPKLSSLAHRVPQADKELLDFMSQLLQVDPDKRPSAEEALAHPWLRKDYGVSY
eukprot:jgi/Mesvir1/21754/Mv04159-RA.1